MKTRVTIELNDNAEDGVIEKSIFIAWCEQEGWAGLGVRKEWWYKCEGWDGYSIQTATSGVAPIDMDIKEILKQVLCEAVDKLVEG